VNEPPKPNPPPLIIVAEVSKTWPTKEPELISNKFEAIINTNIHRGYTLVDWKYSNVFYSRKGEQCITETIIGLFKLTHDVIPFPQIKKPV